MIINEDTIAVKSSTAKRVYTFNVRDIAELITYKNERSSKVTYSVSYIDLNYWGGSWKNSWKNMQPYLLKKLTLIRKSMSN